MTIFSNSKKKNDNRRKIKLGLPLKLPIKQEIIMLLSPAATVFLLARGKLCLAFSKLEGVCQPVFIFKFGLFYLFYTLLNSFIGAQIKLY